MSTHLHDTVRDAAQELTTTLSEALPETDRAAGVACAMDRLLERLSATGVWGPENRLPSSELWKLVEPILSQGSLQLHARTKPHGYAGDYEMLSRICENDRRGDAFGCAFDDYFQRQAAPSAVRNRAQIIADQIVEQVRANPHRTVKVVNVGSGPAQDVWLASRALQGEELARLRVHLVDIDPKALEFCRRRLSPFESQGATFVTHRRNLKRLPGSREVDQLFGNADLIVCPGFLDYLTHREVSRLIRFFYDQLRTDGHLLAFNFAELNPSRAYMEWIGNWYLVYRTLDDLRTARADAGIPESHESLGAEAEKVNLLIQVRK